jgi:hypothetical protein
MIVEGGCHCGAVRYRINGEPITQALCHCTDCRRHAGAPVVSWAMFPDAAVQVIRGTPKVYASSEHGRRHFCPDCGTGFFYLNADAIPGIVDVQTATFDDPGLIPPRVHVQVAERVTWMKHAHELPTFERFPPGS